MSRCYTSPTTRLGALIIATGVLVAPSLALAAAPADTYTSPEHATCNDYTVLAGDSWYRIAERVEVPVGDLLGVNGVTLGATLRRGDQICLPDGAVIASTLAPTSTPALTTTAAPGRDQSTDDVQQIIRDVWPDELEQHALEIAYRESRFVSGADNGWCCVGLFQIYWSVHQSWLDDYGITVRAALADARTNAIAAYALYQRAGGWSPWGG